MKSQALPLRRVRWSIRTTQTEASRQTERRRGWMPKSRICGRNGRRAVPAECAYGRRAEKGEEAELRCLYRNVEFVNQEEGEITCHT